MKVLIVEDEVVSRRLLQSYLERWGHHVVAARDGEEGWNQFQAGEFPIVISDWMMPKMDGLELIRRIRASQRPGYIYAILLTSRSHKEDLVAGMEAGADDFVTKPFDQEELRVRLRAGQRVIELESALLASLKDLAQARQREVEIGARIQQTLLLGQPPQHLPVIRATALSIPSQQIDGDFYDFFQHHNQCLDVIVGDVMGKGVPAALLGAAIKSHFLRALSQLIAAEARDKLPEPQAIVGYVHDGVTKQFIGLEFFATLCYARFDWSRRLLTFVDCGHTKTIHFQRQTGVCQLLEGENTPLGVSEQEIYRQVSVPIAAGDGLLFYSDGVTEAQNATGEFFGVDRLVELVAANGRAETDELIDRVRAAVVEFSDSQTFADDLTCVAVRLEAPEGEIGKDERPLAHAELEVSSELTKLVVLRAFVREFCRNLPPPSLSGKAIDQLELAVAEAASNIVRHGYQGRTGQPIKIDAEAFADRISLRLHHAGVAFDAAAVKPPAFDGSREGGFGVYIIARSVDEVRYARDDDGGNCIWLTKNRHARKEGNPDGNDY